MDTFVYFVISFPSDAAQVDDLDSELLSDDWWHASAPESLKVHGDHWFDDGQSVGLRVPSAIIEGEYNVLLNANHQSFADVDVLGPLELRMDERLKSIW